MSIHEEKSKNQLDNEFKPYEEPKPFGFLKEEDIYVAQEEFSIAQRSLTKNPLYKFVEISHVYDDYEDDLETS